MHRRFLNQARLAITLEPRGPILIKSGVETPDPTRPGMEFVRTRHPQLGDSIYLPGTSLKGALRSHAERCLKGLGVTVCNPFGKRRDSHGGQACHFRIRRSQGQGSRPGHQLFAEHCAACRTFGSLQVAGRLNVTDAYPWNSETPDEATDCVTETRWQVGIERRNGGVAPGTLFDLEVAVKGQFHAEVQLRNFELWQLGLAAAVLRDVDDGLVPIGFGKSRGLGQVGVTIRSLVVDSIRHDESSLLGASGLAGDDGRAYALMTSPDRDRVALDAQASSMHRTWRGSRLELDGNEAVTLIDRIIEGPLSGFTTSDERRAAGG